MARCPGGEQDEGDDGCGQGRAGADAGGVDLGDRRAHDGDRTGQCDLAAAWDHLRLVLARSMGPPGCQLRDHPCPEEVQYAAWGFIRGAWTAVCRILVPLAWKAADDCADQPRNRVSERHRSRLRTSRRDPVRIGDRFG